MHTDFGRESLKNCVIYKNHLCYKIANDFNTVQYLNVLPPFKKCEKNVDYTFVHFMLM